MSQSFTLQGVTCSRCIDSINEVIRSQPQLQLVDITLDPPQATFKEVNDESIAILNQALNEKGGYQLIMPAEQDTPKASAYSYRPLLLILLFLLSVVFIIQWHLGSIDLFLAMRHFMGGFFLTFSFFKLLDLRGFVQAYRGYDLLASRFKAYGFVYPFLELGLGLYFLSPLQYDAALWVALILMSLSSLGVIRSIVYKKQIACACLGTVFNLPMSTVTLVEDLLMVIMSASMLWYL